MLRIASREERLFTFILPDKSRVGPGNVEIPLRIQVAMAIFSHRSLKPRDDGNDNL